MDVSWPDPISLWQSQGHSAVIKKNWSVLGVRVLVHVCLAHQVLKCW